jgi:hypothetical protein
VEVASSVPAESEVVLAGEVHEFRVDDELGFPALLRLSRPFGCELGSYVIRRHVRLRVTIVVVMLRSSLQEEMTLHSHSTPDARRSGRPDEHD